ncbi:Chromatin structure-remodeling complex protein [Wickerhamomyces ciferrii]|uniref:Chromatin structure-remodeling complex protein n=1 Tax=Wickerhamomyces ciferrii (strain ATCC 14091 / BCRC 22168 / CBS 111 / JCM 3599 / NBRC 0793 / NRRL Y-1031 F-60-10) TaxID=1206466 RepID=K0KVS3_WICCF|nr:Chromatin structure-remodeling complex protein [Wickerhamomyces ciferrii]CCH46062.1 Chromatin structure-remodeling complex protein [Wickerhamomyces ciferrii]
MTYSMTQIPIEFEESNPAQISESYHALVDDLGTYKSNSILDRYNDKHYKTIYSLYHDIRLSAYILLLHQEIGSDYYIDVDRFYKFATEFLLRESYRLSIQIQELEEAKNRQSKETPPSEFETVLSQDFIKISTSYSLGNGESFFVMTQNNVPLFSSLNQRSSLDEREILPPEAFSTTIVVPQTISTPATNLGFLAPQVGRIPPPTLPPTEILSRFLHPNWYSLPTAKWLDNSDLQSFAPVVDEQNTVVTSEDRGRLWLEQIGYTKLFDKSVFESKIKDESKDESKESNDIEVPDASKDIITPPTSKSQDDDENHTISLDNLYEWAPGNEIDDDVIEAFEKGEESKLVDDLLNQLNLLRNNRLISNIEYTEPTEQEKKLYYKTNLLLREIVLSTGKVPDIKPSPLLPVLQTNYSGTLPVPTQNLNSKKKNKSRR